MIGHAELCPDNNYGERLGDVDRQAEQTASKSALQRRERDEMAEAWGWGPQQDCFFSPQFHPSQSPEIHCCCKEPHDRDREDKIWEPFVGLLDHLPNLADLVVERMRQLPRSILRSLHKNHLSCRLHMHAFSLESQLCLKHQPKNIDDDEFMLITSPCLYSIITSHSYNYSGWKVDYNGEAIIAMLAQYSPNLRHLWTERRSPRGEIGLSENLRTPRPPWSGFFPDGRINSQDAHCPPLKTGNLGSLILDGDHIALGDYIHATDFSQLSSLHIMGLVNSDMMRELVQLGQRGGLRLLQSLGLSLGYDIDPRSNELACELLDCVPSLQYFALDTCDEPEKLLSVVFQRHGQTLRTLSIQGVETSPACVEELQSRCRSLKQLAITLRRKPGDENEADIYRALGRLPQLERLSIWLAFPPPNEEAIDHNFQSSHSDEECEKYLQRDLPQFAIEADLAKSMFRTVATEQLARAGRSSLERLCLRPRSDWSNYADVSELSGPTFRDMAEWIARSWVCRPRRWTDTRDVNDAGIEKLDLVAERCFVSVNNKQMNENMEDMVWDGITGKAWKDIWLDAGDDWLESWSSIPILGSDWAS